MAQDLFFRGGGGREKYFNISVIFASLNDILNL